MSIENLIVRLKELKIVVRLDNGQLKIDAPKGTLTSKLIDELKERKSELIAFIDRFKTKEEYTEIKVLEKKQYYQTSLIQQRMYIVNELAREKTPYNLSMSCILEGGIDKIKINKAVNELAKRHEVLRTSFRLIDGTLVQEVHDNVEIEIIYSFCDESERGEILKKFIRPFDLTRTPLLRVEIVSFSSDRHLFLSDTHHIVSDGTSNEIFLRDFAKLINDVTISPLRIQFKDYVGWQYSKEGIRKILKQETYWLGKFKDYIPVLNLQADYPRGPVQDFEGTYIHYQMDEKIVDGIFNLIREEEVTLYIFLLASINILLSKYTGQEDIIIGSPVAGRNHDELQHVLGVFINALPMRNYPKGNYSFSDFLKQVKKHTLEAYENQNYQLGDLLGKLDIDTEMNRNPMFDIELVLQNYERANIEIEGVSIIPQKSNLNVSQVDVAFFVTQSENSFSIHLNYCTKLYNTSTMDKLLENLCFVVEQIVNNRNIKLSDIKLSKNFTEVKAGYFIGEDEDNFNF